MAEKFDMKRVETTPRLPAITQATGDQSADVRESLRIVSSVVLLILVVFGNLWSLRWLKPDVLGVPFCRVCRPLLLTSLVNGSINFTTLLISSLTGRWLMKQAGCQVFGFVSHSLIGLNIWILTLGSVERYYKIVVSSEYQTTFSHINTKIILWGIVLCVMIVSVCPLYGIGEYSYFRGKLKMTLVIPNKTTPESQMGLDFDFYVTNVLMYKPGNDTAQSNLVESIYQIRTCLEELYDINIYSNYIASSGIVMDLRIPTYHVLQDLWTNYENQNLSQILHQSDQCSSSLKQPPKFNLSHFKIVLNEEEYILLKTVHIKTQGLGICSTDFTSTNRQVDVWTAFLLCVYFVAPFHVMLFCYSAIYWKTSKLKRNVCDTELGLQDYRIVYMFLNISVVTLCLLLLYYSLSIVNALGYYISPDLMFAAALLFYSSNCLAAIAVSFPDICHALGQNVRRPRCLANKQETENFEMRSKC